MPIIQTFNPMDAASDAVGSYFTAKRQREVENQAQAHQAAREQRSDMESDRTYGMDKQRADDTHSLVPGQITAQGDAHTDAVQGEQLNKIKIAAAKNDADYNQQIRPLLLQEQALKNKFSRGEILSQGDTHTLAQLQNQIKAVEAKHAQTKAVLDEAQQRASIRSSDASANASNASAWRSRNEPFYNPNAATQAYSSAINSLSPAATAFVQHLQSSGTSMTPIQAELAVRSAPGLTAQDKAGLMTILNGSSASDFQPLTGKPPKVTEPPGLTTELNVYRTNPKFKALPASEQASFIDAVRQLQSSSSAVQVYQKAAADPAFAAKHQIDQNQAAQVLNAIGVSTQQAGAFKWPWQH